VKNSPAKHEIIAETLCMAELKENLPEIRHSSGLCPSSKTRKKNPRILLNGEKIVDSDIEEKKELKQKYLSV
jgi:hypothetical protein